MSENLKKKHRLTWAWNYEKEEQWINELSEQGLHLKKPGLFTSLFSYDPSVRYTYGMDYQPELRTSSKLQDYFDLYQDAGWEHITSYKGVWHYFRREWNPGERPRLYTDRESLVVQYKKLQRVIGLLLLLNLVIFSVNMANLFSRFSSSLWGIILPVMAIYIILFGLLGYGYVKMGNKIKKQAN
ncbi:DUF2812 domain-containing protein [Paenibacillus sp. HJL G12]|uniref:DUF2812 domain-containing protein n=1 Tax=Paenibacillus dendrobii TaxID=2691084 RepID=A0A7X3IH22_9BACL|nr:DUF2812 domain-containing protein [Paenibacillus dendrobii]MWV43141.1 DUF2812 domain-containing protein [Paenibacillus dendrobii]